MTAAVAAPTPELSVLAAQTAMARASAASSGRGRSDIASTIWTIRWTCSLSAAPYPAIADLTSFGVASRTGTPCCAAANSTTPRAWPTAKAVCTFFEKNSRSTATTAGSCSAISSSTQAWIASSRSGSDESGDVTRQP